jgi:hypothetical protein
MMSKRVKNGYAITRARSQRRRTNGASTRAHQVDQPMCMLGMAAYWFETAAISSLPNDAHPP